MRTQLNLKDCQVLVLHKRTKAVLIGDAMFGAEGSRHSNFWFVLALHARSGEYRLAKILFFAECITIAEFGSTVMPALMIPYDTIHICMHRGSCHNTYMYAQGLVWATGLKERQT